MTHRPTSSAPHGRSPGRAALRLVHDRDRAERQTVEIDLGALTDLGQADRPLSTGMPLSAALAAALDAVAGATACDLVTVPREPEPQMTAAAVVDAGVDPMTAARVWRAMVRASE